VKQGHRRVSEPNGTLITGSLTALQLGSVRVQLQISHLRRGFLQASPAVLEDSPSVAPQA